MDYETNFAKPSLNPASLRDNDVNLNKHLEVEKNGTCKALKVEPNQNLVLAPHN